MKTILIAVQDSARAHEWVQAFQEQDPSWEVRIWDPSRPASGAHYAVVWQPPTSLFEHETNLQAVFNLGAGVDALGIGLTVPTTMPVYRIEDAGMAAQMAEYALYGVLLATQRFGAYAAQQQAQIWQPQPAVLRTDWPIGMMGYGQIGAQVAHSLAQLGYPVAAWARRARTEAPEQVRIYAGDDQLMPFLQRSRILVNVLPLTDATRGLINKKTLAALLPQSFVINMARGAHIVDADLLAALDSNHLKGALLDVFSTEPLPADSPLWTHPNIHITPHIAGISLRQESAQQVLEKLNQLRQGIEPSGRVDPRYQY